MKGTRPRIAPRQRRILGSPDGRSHDKTTLVYEARVDQAIRDIERLRGRISDIRAAFDGAEKSASKYVQRLDEIAKKRLRGTLPSQAGSIDDLRAGVGGSRARGINLGRVDSAATMTDRALSGLGQEQIGSALVRVDDAAQIGQVLQNAAAGTGAIAKAAQSLLTEVFGENASTTCSSSARAIYNAF